MGIRFQCHHCSHQLHVKDFQAGKRGRCPACKGPFRIPQSNANFSIAITETENANSLVGQTVGELATESPLVVSSRAAGAADTVPTRMDSSAQSDQLQERSRMQQLQPQVLAEAPDATWYVRPASGGQYGPAPASVVWEWLIEDRIGHDSLVWREDWPEWQAAKQVFGDYFESGDDAPLTVSISNTPASITTTSTPMQLPNQGSTVPAGNARELRKRSRRTKYTVAIALLAVVFILLAVGLIIVLNQQGILGGSPK